MIAAATVDDIPALVTLVNSAYRGDSSRKGWTTEADLLGGSRTDAETLGEMMHSKGSILFKYIDEENSITACIYLQKQDTRLYLGMLTVSPGMQDRGIGKLLLNKATEYALTNDATTIYMTVISLRAELIEWYERHGYRKTGETKPFPSDTKFGIARRPLELIILEKTL